MKQMMNQKGFSLIELMIVVAIIGILSAIAVPNFARFQAKARQSEARGNLSGYYQASKASYAEFGFYAGNFVAIGFQPEGTLNYRITAANGGTPPPNNLPNDAACLNTSDACNGVVASFPTWTEAAATGSMGPQAAANGNCAAATNNAATPPTFTACATGRIGANAVDGWSITQAKVVTNTQSGVP